MTAEREMLFKDGAVVGNYRVIRSLGKGGMGEVYEVEHQRLGVRYALKAFVLAHGEVDLLRERFVAEGKVLARLQHPNLVRVFELDLDKGTGALYFVMDLVSGTPGGIRSFADLDNYPAEESDLARWFEQLCGALDYIHAQGIVHRDIKPSNVLVDGANNVRLVDFGVSRYVSESVREELSISQTKFGGDWRTGTFNTRMGTGAFMAPEVRAGRPATPSSDAYSLGMMFFRLLTGVWYEPHRNMLRLLEPLEGNWQNSLKPLLMEPPNQRPAKLSSIAKVEFCTLTPEVVPPSRPSRSLAKRYWPWAASILLTAAILPLAIPHPNNQPEVTPPKTTPPVTTPKVTPPIKLPPFKKELVAMVWCPAGELTMGSPEKEQGRFGNEYPHRVMLSHGFWIANCETSQGLWKYVMDGETVVDLARKALNSKEPDDIGSGNVESHVESSHIWTIPTDIDPKARCGDMRDDYPVYYVSWEAATNFCARLTEMARRSGDLPPGYVYRLPTEAEWEYACRAGSSTSLPGNRNMHILGDNECVELDDFAWFGGNSCNDFSGTGFDVSAWPGRMYDGTIAAPHKCATRRPNAWGIYDMLGNVWEWCLDWYGDYPQSALQDPQSAMKDPHGPVSGHYHVVRGGSWNALARQCRAAYRTGLPSGLGNLIGFRLVLAPASK